MSRLAELHGDAVALLHALTGPHGIHASLSSTANYRAVFTRDAVMAGIAGLLLDAPELGRGLARTLDGLRALQGPEGQIASNFEARDGADTQVSFGTLAPRLDGATWYLVGVALAARGGVIDAPRFRGSVERVVRLLDAIEYNGRHLLYVPTGGNWADEYVYEGYILYDQVLRAWGLRLTSELYGEPTWRAKADAIGRTIAERFAPAPDAAARHPLAAFTPARAWTTFDLAACALLAVADVAPPLAALGLDWVEREWLARDALPPAFAPVIADGDPDWPALRRYHLHGFRNAPHEYHNGGVWPIWLGWLALALAHAGRREALATLRALVETRIDALPGFAFEEYLHGRTGAPGGTARMAYSATGIVFLRLADAAPAARLLAATSDGVGAR